MPTLIFITVLSHLYFHKTSCDGTNVRTYVVHALRAQEQKPAIRIAHVGAPERDGSSRPGPGKNLPKASAHSELSDLQRGLGGWHAGYPRVPHSHFHTSPWTRTTTRAVKSHRARHGPGGPRTQRRRPHHQLGVPVPVQSGARASKAAKQNNASAAAIGQCQSSNPSRPARRARRPSDMIPPPTTSRTVWHCHAGYPIGLVRVLV